MFLDEIAARLVSLGVGTINTTTANSIFMSSAAKIPSGDGPFVTLTETGGAAPGGFRGAAGRVHNEAGAHTQSPGAQVLVRAKTYAAARTKAKEIHAVLDGVWNTTLSGVFYQQITARQEPTDAGVDEAGRAVVVFNLDAIKQPS